MYLCCHLLSILFPDRLHVGGTLELWGESYGPTWTRLAATVAANATSITLKVCAQNTTSFSILKLILISILCLGKCELAPRPAHHRDLD